MSVPTLNITDLQASSAKAKETMERFRAARDSGFPHDICLKLMYETIDAVAQNQLVLCQTTFAMMDANRENIEWLKRKVEESSK